MAVLSSFSLIFSFFRLSFGLLPRTQAKHSIYMLRYFAILQLRLATSSRLAYGYFSAGLPYFIFFLCPLLFARLHIKISYMNFCFINISCSYFRWLATG